MRGYILHLQPKTLCVAIFRSLFVFKRPKDQTVRFAGCGSGSFYAVPEPAFEIHANPDFWLDFFCFIHDKSK